MKPLAIVPTYLTSGVGLQVAFTALESARRTGGDSFDLLVVDDGSPERDLVKALRGRQDELGFDLVARDENAGFSRTVNVGLRRALDEGRDAILVNADIEFLSEWVRPMQETATERGPAGIVGAKLLYPNGTIQHGGVYFSILHRCFEHSYKHGPHDLPEANVPRVVPVTGALQFIRHSTLTTVGLYDERFRLGWEDVDFGIRAWLAGIESVYNPAIVALHHESFFRSDPSPKVREWTAQSWAYFVQKYAHQSFAEFVPAVA